MRRLHAENKCQNFEITTKPSSRRIRDCTQDITVFLTAELPRKNRRNFPRMNPSLLRQASVNCSSCKSTCPCSELALVTQQRGAADDPTISGISSHSAFIQRIHLLRRKCRYVFARRKVCRYRCITVADSEARLEHGETRQDR
jgi:hypothetical protein